VTKYGLKGVEGNQKEVIIMQRKGLCITCINDKTCTFPRRFPVIQCEEFTGYDPRPTKVKTGRLSKMRFNEEFTVWE
jgi:hypothetical protein